jgi:hypothetical protein
MRVYISGPMTGHADLNAPLFAAAAQWVAGQNREPVNPHDVVASHDGDCPEGPRFTSLADGREHAYGCFIRADLAALLTCDEILLLPGWERSRGARAERDVAEICGMSIHLFDPQPVA